MGSKTDSVKSEGFEDLLKKVAKEVTSKGTPAESHATNKFCLDLTAYLLQRKNAFSGEIDMVFVQNYFRLLQLCFRSEQSAIQASGLALMQKCLEDTRFVPRNLTGEARKEFSGMFVNVLSELCIHGSDETAVEILRVSLHFALHWSEDPYALIKIISFCMYCSGLRKSPNVKTAAAATNVQAVTSFCRTVLNDDISKDSVLPADFQTVLTFLGDNLENLQNFTDDAKGVEVLRTTLLSIYSILQSTSNSVQKHPQFQEYIWRKVTPALCHWLGKPAEMYMQSISQQARAAAGLITVADMEMVEIKLISQIFVHLAKTYSRTDSMRCVLGSLLQRMMSVASVRQRLYTLHSISEVLESAQLLSDLEGPNTDGNMPDTCLTAIIAVALAKLAVIRHPEVEAVCTKLALSLLTSLEHVVDGHTLSEEQVASVNRAFSLLWDTSPPSQDTIEKNIEALVSKRPPKLQIGNGQSTESEPGTTVDIDVASSRANGDSIDNSETLDTPTPGPDPTVKFEFPPLRDLISSPRTDFDEKQSAHRFVETLLLKIPDLIKKISTVDADEAMQQFASTFCEEEKGLFHGVPYLNGDGVYVAAYQTFRYTIRAREMRYYTRKSTANGLVPMTEKEFVSGVLGCGLLVYMSVVWIGELFAIVSSRDLLAEAGCTPAELESPFVQTVRDIDGSGNDHPYLSDYARLDGLSRKMFEPPKVAGVKLARYLLSRCWTGLQQTLQCAFLDCFSRKKLFTLKKDFTENSLQLMCSALGGLQRYADLCAHLHLHELCSSAYALLARVCCSSLYPQPALQSRNKSVHLQLHPWIVLSIDVVLRRSLDMGSRNPDCWKAFFTCYLYLHRLETKFLISAKTPSLTKRELQDCSSTIKDITTRFGGNTETKASEALDTDHSYLALGALLNALDVCFLDATRKLNLTNLCNFIRMLGDASMRVPSEQVMLLERLANVVIMSSKCGRPLLHVMIIWASAVPFLYQAAASQQSVVSEKAVTSMWSIVAVLTATMNEHEHFHFNELQLKPFESLICSQVSIELQERIVYSLCNLVETTKSDIRSGWKSLFCTLRGIQIEAKSGNLLQAVSDVYEAYLHSDNVKVFSSSLWECVQSLIKLYRSSLDISTAGQLTLAGQAALKYLNHASRLLFSLSLMPEFTGLVEKDRLRVLSSTIQQVDMVLPNAPTVESLEEHLLEEIYRWIPDEEIRIQLQSRYFSRSTTETMDEEKTHSLIVQWDNGKGVLLAVYNIVDNLTASWNNTYGAMNNNSVETVMEILRAGSEKGHPEFGLLLASSSVVPVIQQILRGKYQRCDSAFQQLIGSLTDVVGDIFLQNFEVLSDSPRGDEYLRSVLYILAECSLSDREALVRLSISSFKHLIAKVCEVPKNVFRCTMARCLLDILHATFAPLRDLMVCYNNHSKSIYGDSGHVKVTITNESSYNEMLKIRQTAFRVFLTEAQTSNESHTAFDPDSSSPGKSFTFLVYPSELDYHVSTDLFVRRVPLERLVRGLLGHEQILTLVRQVLHMHLRTERYSYMDDRERLFLLCALRQSCNLTADFNHLSGLKFLIKRVLASPHSIHLYQLNNLAGTIHSTELLALCARIGNTASILKEQRPREQLLIKDDHCMHEITSSTFVEYFRSWAVKMVECYCTTFDCSLHIDPSSKSGRERQEDDEEDRTEEEEPKSQDGLTDITLESNVVHKSYSSMSLLVEALKKCIPEKVISEYLDRMAAVTGKKNSSTESASETNSSKSGDSRKNPFREPVTPSTELPSEVAQELLAAMEEDKGICRQVCTNPLEACFDLALSAGNMDKLAMAPLLFYVCRLLVETSELRADSGFFERMERFLVWLKDALK
ncbi:hypothetical protein RvY_05437 [Ramazzottius varieornatus]|uniref:SEC7 domain-containing protein n=1 Tax=Ramazzottius varieornatus TaxID=947166 RepID=A0A1D1UUZ6_RAMVA|nr:hypothetical protein RvY_05437 [Ramazzottius varieornatus]